MTPLNPRFSSENQVIIHPSTAEKFNFVQNRQNLSANYSTGRGPAKNVLLTDILTGYKPIKKKKANRYRFHRFSFKLIEGL